MREIVIGAFNQSIKENGFIEPHTTARIIAIEAGISNPHTEQQIARTIFEYPTGEFLRPGAFDTLREIVSPSDPSIIPGTATIWTDDYSIRVASSGIGELRRSLSDEARKRLRVAFNKDDKVSLLSGLAWTAEKEGSEMFWVVDDNEENLNRAHQLMIRSRLGRSPIPCGFVLVDGNTPTTELDHQFGSGIDFRVNSIRDLLTIQQKWHKAQRLSWAIDFNGPILDREAYIAAREDVVTCQVEQYVSDSS